MRGVAPSVRFLRIVGTGLLWGFAAIGLATTVLVVFSIQLDSGCGRCTSAQAQIYNLEGLLELYRMDIGSFPTTRQGLAALVAESAGEAVPEGYPPVATSEADVSPSTTGDAPTSIAAPGSGTRTDSTSGPSARTGAQAVRGPMPMSPTGGQRRNDPFNSA